MTVSRKCWKNSELYENSVLYIRTLFLSDQFEIFEGLVQTVFVGAGGNMIRRFFCALAAAAHGNGVTADFKHRDVDRFIAEGDGIRRVLAKMVQEHADGVGFADAFR